MVCRRRWPQAIRRLAAGARIGTCALMLLCGCTPQEPEAVTGPLLSAPDPHQLAWIGHRVFQNECAGRSECLVHWNEGEAFPSLGIGHFIWYPENVNGPFVESFPALIRFMQERQVPLPRWLEQRDPFTAPWPDRRSFLAQKDSPRVRELREFLAATQEVQAAFIVDRARSALIRVLAAVPETRQARVRHYLEELGSTPGGLYALIDYVNFKGEGLAETERYQGQGWGLLQVLMAMDPGPGQTALDAFREAAGRILTRRAHNADSPMERERWLPGWLRRIDTYREPEPDKSL